MPHPARLVVATSNRGKLRELRSLLGSLPVEVVTVDDVLGRPLRVSEDGTTFADNAIKKASAAAQATGLLALADDSGLEVDALGGLPGVRSARFAGESATDADNNAALLAALGAAGVDASPARFRCVLALVAPPGARSSVRTFEGACEGTIIRTPRGGGGFGYDSLFVLTGDGRTMAELSDSAKDCVSHRARAFGQLAPALRGWLKLREGLDEGQR